jgi:sporulation protein YlmC with PRC-barrel domain
LEQIVADPISLVGDHALIIGGEMTEASASPSVNDLPEEELAVDGAIPANAPEANANQTHAETDSTVAHRDFSEWHGKDLIDRDGERIGKLEDVYFDVGTDQPQFATVKEGLIGRHLTFVPLTEVTIGPDNLQVSASKAEVKDAPNLDVERDELSQSDESTLYHYYQLNYTPSDTPSGRRLARR